MSTGQLYDYQQQAIEGLRDGFRAGHRCQMLYLPTGGGKSVCAVDMIASAEARRTRTAFLVERTNLLEQFSRHLDSAEIGHGIIQADHWRNRPYERVQVCSQQTLESRGWPKVDLCIIDEAHLLRAGVKAWIDRCPEMRVVGLSATPFTRGLGQTFTNVVSPTNTNQLIEQGRLVGMKVFAGVEADLRGAKKTASEWQADDVASRSVPIIGNITAEWVKHAHLYGDPRQFKTFLFSPTVDYGEMLCEQFDSLGYRFEQISYRDNNHAKREKLLAELNDMGSDLCGIISVDALGRGTDVPNLRCVDMCRPFRKSFASHIQFLGRGLRTAPGKEYVTVLDHSGNCVARGSRVLTDSGFKRIENITRNDLVYDGSTFVRHKGAICRGIKPVIRYSGLVATPDHEVLTAQGWRTFGDCAAQQIPIVQAGVAWQEAWARQDSVTVGDSAWQEGSSIHTRHMRVHNLWKQVSYQLEQLGGRANARLSSVLRSVKVEKEIWKASVCSRWGARLWRYTEMAFVSNQKHAHTLSESTLAPVQGLRSERCEVHVRHSAGCRALDNGESGDTEVRDDCRTLWHSVGSDRPGRELRAGEYTMVSCSVQHAQSSWPSGSGQTTQVPVGASGNQVRRSHVGGLLASRDDARADHREVLQEVGQAEREVWDILDCGPNHRFACEGLIVHNCIRFADDMQYLFEHGCTSLDDGRLKDGVRKEKTAKEKKEVTCSCGAILMPWDKQCPACGKVRQRKLSAVENVPGELREIMLAAKRNKETPIDDKQAFYAGLRTYAHLHGYKEGWAAHTYKDRYSVFPRFGEVGYGPVTPEVLGWIKHKQIAYQHRKRA